MMAHPAKMAPTSRLERRCSRSATRTRAEQKGQHKEAVVRPHLARTDGLTATSTRTNFSEQNPF
ncbi:hypothetical protein IscW_ISCW002200 [Ixodes scapularis]|uniref:Uncharacterized protein n=1 Tax=Ixodes scapularis TaxID=6945 RepID=B7P9M1_IXOSC|nr:hypothetical protein IscW_ISCW002200 [Ixodes scapularis]|eukprot:XP_002404767.1 hypothetical protein IscW_ISCW002200 [Ixodes scapularis]